MVIGPHRAGLAAAPAREGDGRDGYLDKEEMPAEAARAIRLTRHGMWWEALARALWPGFVLLAAGLTALALGAAMAVPAGWLPVAVGGWLAAVGLAGVLGAARIRRPRRAEAKARVDATLPGRPLAALGDRVAVGGADPGAGALWRAHLAQMRALAAGARRVPGRPGLARRDPFGLRLAALTGLAMAALFGSAGHLGEGLGALAASFRGPALPQGATAAGPGWEGWAAPPDYTRRPVIYMNALPEGEGLSLPEGSRLSFRLYGEGATVRQDVGEALAGNPAGAPVLTALRSGTVTVAGRRFAIEVLPDDPPTIAPGAAPQRRADGRLVQRFAAADDNGVVTAAATITLDLPAVDRRFGLTAAPDPRQPVVLDLPLPRRGTRAEVSGTLVSDLSQHPWANLPVTISLRATDGIGQTGTAPPMAMILPGRRFFDPLAAALIELRRDILWSRANAAEAAQLLRAVVWQPEGLLEPSAQQKLAGVIAALEGPPLTAGAQAAAAKTLWDAAVLLEDGGLADALEAMQRAQQRLSEAIRNGASPDEVRRLMEELKQATSDYTKMLAEQGKADPNERFVKDQPSQRITGDQIQKMMDEIERLMNEGKMAEAEALLEQFNRMMQNLKVTEGQGEGDPSGQGGSSGRLADTLRQQQRLADDAMRQLQDQFMRPPGADGVPQDEGQPGQGTQADGQSGDGQSGAGQSGPGQSGGGGDLAGRQRALREQLGRQGEMLPGPGTPEGEAARRQLDRAGRAMDEAGQALRDQDLGGAMDRQAEAIEAMREGLRALGRLRGDDSRQPGGAPRPPEGEAGGDTPGGRRESAQPYLPRPPVDPLGRETSGNGTGVTTGDPLAETDRDPAARAHQLLDEIRRRTGEQQRPADERDYLRRLLDQF